MPHLIRKEHIQDIEKPRTIFVHGILLPIQEEFLKWSDKDENGNKIEGSGGVVEYEEWLKLPEDKRGRKWYFQIDQRMFHPEWQQPTQRAVMIGFREWREIVLPSIKDTVGLGNKSLAKFIDHSLEGNWYVEAELVPTGVMYNNKPQNTFKFIRMTQDEQTIREWYKERYPDTEQTTQVPEEIIEQAKTLFTHRAVANRNRDKFLTIVSANEELAPYLTALAEMCKEW